jgi:hypothetical protein
MKAEIIYNKAVEELTTLAKDCIRRIAGDRHGIDPREYGEDGDGITRIMMDEAGNITVDSTNEEEAFFTELPMNTMVFICIILENILEKGYGK